MRTEDLIVRLAGSVTPVRPLPPPMRRFWRWTLVTLAATAAGVAVFGARPDAARVLSRPAFLAPLALTLLTAWLSARAAFVLSVPGGERSAADRWTPMAAGAAWASWLAIAVVLRGSPLARIAGSFPLHWGCVIQISLLAVAPGALLFVMLRRAAPLRARWSAGLAGLAAAALGAAGTQWICPLDNPAHLLTNHFMTMGLVAAAGTLLPVAAPGLLARR